MTTIKITQLTDIGANLASTTVFPVVNMTGTPTTQKTVLSNIANVILAGAGGNYVSVGSATLAGTVTTNAQPNITSVGNLTGLTVSNASGVVNFSNTANVTLGAVGNLRITGGTSGQKLTTNGSGGLSWTDDANSSYGNSNVAAYLPTYAGNVGANWVIATYFSGNAHNLTYLPGANVNGAVSFATTANSVAAANVSGLVNVALINLDGNISNVLHGDGSWSADATTYSNSNVASYLPTYTGNVGAGNVIATGNLYSAGLLSNGVANVNSNVVSTNFNTGALKVRGGIGAVGNVHSGGEIHSGGNVVVGGQSLFVGPSADATGLTNPTIIAFHGGDDYIQAALKNSLSTGSADWVAYGDNGTDSQGWADFGFTSSAFDDPTYTITGPGDGYFFVQTYAGSYGGNLIIATGSEGTVRDIIFATGGFLAADEFARIDDTNNRFHLTRTGSGIKFADGTTQTTAYTGGGNTGNVTFDNVTVQGDNNSLNLSAGNSFTANLAYLQVRAGDVASHIHLDTGNNSAYDLIVGDDQNYVQVSSTGNILLSSYDSNTAQYTWTLDYNGNLILAGGNSVIQSIANSSLDILNPNVSTMVLTPDPGYSSQALVLDPTSVGHIHLRSPSASSNIDDPSANLFLGGEASSFEVGIGYGSAPNVYVHSNNNTWTFDTTGNLTIPGTSGGMIKTVANGAIGIVAMDNGTNNPAQLLSMNVGNGNATSIVSAYSTNVAIQTNASGAINTWKFDNAGNLTLPANTFAINYANGTQVSFSGSNISNGNSNVTIATSAGNVVTNVNAQTILTVYSGGIKVGGSGVLQSPGGATAVTLNNNGANLPIANITNTLNVTGAAGANITSNLVVGGTVTSTGKIGYSTGGNATQSSTGAGVTINQLTGLVTLANRTYNAGDLEAFAISCNKVSNDDFVLVQMVDSVNAPSYNVVAYPNFVLANTISVLVKTLETVGTDTPILKFMIVKAPIA